MKETLLNGERMLTRVLMYALIGSGAVLVGTFLLELAGVHAIEHADTIILVAWGVGLILGGLWYIGRSITEPIRRSDDE